MIATPEEPPTDPDYTADEDAGFADEMDEALMRLNKLIESAAARGCSIELVQPFPRVMPLQVNVPWIKLHVWRDLL